MAETIQIMLAVNNANAGPTVFAGAGNDTVTMGATVPSPATIYGGDGNDTLVGAAMAQSLYGEGGKDSIDGGEGPDYISAEAWRLTRRRARNDLIYGGPGDDTIGGGNGNDNLSGGMA